jgi:MFS superfamily sulfate permease-like transporter
MTPHTPPHPWLASVRNDIYGGLVSGAIAIPLAMGFGMFAFSSLGESYFADGALAGLATAFIVGVVCILLGDKTTRCSRRASTARSFSACCSTAWCIPTSRPSRPVVRRSRWRSCSR